MMKKISAFKDKTVLITGNTGFKGSWMSLWLESLGAKVIGVSSGVPTTPSNFEAISIQNSIIHYNGDICNTDFLKKVINKHQPDFFFHFAAQALVKNSYENPLNTMMVNAIGTASVLESLLDYEKKIVLVLITSDKAYDNVEWVWGYRETDSLGGKDPYSASKGMAELAIKSYYHSFYKTNKFVKLGITRAGNVIGGGDWAEDRIVPDSIKAWADSSPVEIRSPKSTRPWQHVLEPLSGYLLLAMKLFNNEVQSGEPFNFGPSSENNQSVEELIIQMTKHWENASWNDVSNKKEIFHEAGLLKLNCDKAYLQLGWLPSLTFEETVKLTTKWYKLFYSQKNNESIRDFSISQINYYTDKARQKGQTWCN